MTAPSVVTSNGQAQLYSLNGSQATWTIFTPPATCDGYILIVANTSGIHPQITSGNQSDLYWFDMSAQANLAGSFSSQVSNASTTWNMSIFGAPLPSSQYLFANSWGSTPVIINFGGVWDAACAFLIAIIGDWLPNSLTWDRGVLDGPIFFNGANLTDTNPQKYSSNTFDTLTFCATMTDNASWGGEQPNYNGNGSTLFTPGDTKGINGSQSIHAGWSSFPHTNSALLSPQLFWQENGQGVNMANMVWSMSAADGIGGGQAADNFIAFTRFPAKVRMINSGVIR